MPIGHALVNAVLVLALTRGGETVVLEVLKCSEFGSDDVFLIKNLAPQLALPGLLEDALAQDPIRVTIADASESWEERTLTVGTSLWNLLSQESLVSLVTDTLQSPISKVVAWTNRCFQGEGIPCHKDSSGDIQLLLLLDGPDPNTAGLWLESRFGFTYVPMSCGDAVLFRASQINHRTDSVPLTAKPRVTAVMRFYAAVTPNSVI